MANNYNNQREIPQKPLMEDAKSALSGQWGMAIGAYVIIIVLSGIGGIIPYGSIVVAGPLTLGMTIFSLHISRNQEADIGNIFDGFKNFVPALLTYLLMILAVVIGSILLIVPGIILSFGLSQSMFILADEPDIGPVEALKKSWEMMKGHKMDIFILGLRFLPWALLCILTLGIGLLWLGPWMQVTFANFYNELIGYGEDKDDTLEHLVV